MAIAWPTLALGLESFRPVEPADVAPAVFSARSLGLLVRSVLLAATATIGSIILSLPAAFALGKVGRLSRSPGLLMVVATGLLCPPMVSCFAWERLLPVWVPGSLRCVGVWAFWSWPIPALLLGTGWARSGRQAYEDALLLMSPFAAFVRVALATLRGHGLFAALLLFLVFFNDYGVPHACGLIVYATEVLSWAQQTSAPGQVVRASILALLVTVNLLVVVPILSRRFAVEDPGSVAGGNIGFVVGLFAFLIFAIAWILPVGAMAVLLGASSAMVEAYHTYSGDLFWSIVTAIAAGAAATLMGLVGASSRRAFGFVIGWTAMFGALPGALVGEAMVAAYNHASLTAIYDHWPIVALSYAARFAWIGAFAAFITVRRVDKAVLESARIDGAREATVFWRIAFAGHWPTALAATAVIAALSVADIATSSLVRVPGYNPIAHVLMEKFHRFEFGMLMALSLWLVATTIPAVGLILYAIRRQAV